jgi:Ca2+-binding RTX toxin-like protein
MATASEVQSLYIAYFGRPADPNGLAYWTTGVGATTPLSEIATGFATTDEFKATTAGRPTAEVISKFYTNLFNRPGVNGPIDIDGLNFWVRAVDSGQLTLEEVGLNIAQAALALPPSNTDRIAEESKIVAAGQWTSAIGSTSAGVLAYTGENGILAGITFLAPVVTPATTPSVAQTDAAVAAFVGGGGGGPNTLNLTTGVDIYSATQGSSGGVANPLFRFSGDNQFVNADATTLTSGDTLTDPSTADNDSLTVSNVSLINLLPANDDNPVATRGTLNISNIENLNFALANGRGFYNFGDLSFNGVKTIKVTGTFSADNFDSGFQDWDNTGATTFDASGLTGSNSGGGEFLIQADTNPGNLTVIGSAGNDNILTDDGNDTVNAGAGNDFVRTRIGADTVTLGAGLDTYRFADGDGGGSLVGQTVGATTFDNNDTLSFNGAIDIVTDFNQFDDTLDTDGAFNTAFQLNGATLAGTAVFNSNVWVRGEFNGVTFTVNNAGADVLVFNKFGNINDLSSGGYFNANYFVLDNFAGTLASGNFV